MPEKIVIPRLSLVMLMGPTGAGKTTFAARHFAPTETLSSDRLRAMIDDDENSQAATDDAFEVLRLLAAKRLARGRFTVIDATNLNADDRRPLVKLGQKHHAAVVAIVLNIDKETCHQRNEARTDRRDMKRQIVDRQAAALEKNLPKLRREGFYRVYTLEGPEEVEAAVVEKERMRSDRCELHGPFDIIGDVHGCQEELEQLLRRLGYDPDDAGVWRHGEGRVAVFLGDLINRGPRSVDALRLVMDMVDAGSGLCVPGNHENLLHTWMQGKTFVPAHGLRQTLDETDKMPEADYKAFKERFSDFMREMESHLILDGGRLVVAHAGMPAELAGRVGVRRFALYGETRREIDGYAKRIWPGWTQRYQAKATAVYGHVAVVEPTRRGNTLNIDTGCVFGGALTALRYPEGEFVSVPAARVYFEPEHKPPPPEVPDAKAPETKTNEAKTTAIKTSPGAEAEAGAAPVETPMSENPDTEACAPGPPTAVHTPPSETQPEAPSETPPEAPSPDETPPAEAPSEQPATPEAPVETPHAAKPAVESPSTEPAETHASAQTSPEAAPEAVPETEPTPDKPTP